jgi:hypothetical protein
VIAPMPPVSDVWKAIETYLRLAYPGAQPSAVRARMRTLRSLPDEDFFASDIFEKDSREHPNRWCLRLGNSLYPHMKLCINRRPDKRGFVFRADTHDRHCCPPPGTREYGHFCELMNKNQHMAQEIESAWEAQHLPTFKSYLKQDLANRAKT